MCVLVVSLALAPDACRHTRRTNPPDTTSSTAAASCLTGRGQI